nr:sulfite exporter TauE/SafE family protein [Roseibium denhamense]
MVFFGAGIIKGAVGFGLPTIGLGLMTVFVGVEAAIVLVLWPAFLTNVWQAASGGQFKPLVARLWPFLLAAGSTLFAGTFLLTQLQVGLADFVLGLLMIAYAVPLLAGVKFHIGRHFERPAGVVLGSINGVFAGLTGSYTVPGVLYLQALGLSKDELVQAMGMLFLTSTVALSVSLGSFGILSNSGVMASAALCVPTSAGVFAGQYIRRRLSEQGFRRLVLASILALGLYLIPLGLYRLISG